MRKLVKGVLIILTLLVIVASGIFLFYFPKLMAGMDAKLVCSCMFVAGRNFESIKQKELDVFPGLSSADIQINTNDSTVFVKFLGRTAKAIYRRGLGCTLIAEKSEQELKQQNIRIRNIFPVDQDTIDWPMGNRIREQKIPGVNYDAVNNAIDVAFADVNPEKPVYTHGVVVVYEGQLLGEKYAPGFDYNSRHMGWSMTKSVMNALVGILVKERQLKIDDPAPVSEWRNDDRRNITLNNLLQASSGLEWEEGYFSPTSHFHKMFILSDDKAHYAAMRKLENPPARVFEYSSGTTNMISRIIRQAIGDSLYHNFPYEKLFHKIGMNQAIIEVDASGTFVGSSYGWASGRDWARFGMLYLNDGVFNGERILPEGWVSYSTSPASSAPLQEYGAQIWLNRGERNNPANCKFPGLPNEAFVFDGFEENSVVVIPSRKTVIVRLGVTHNQNFDLAKLVNGVLDALPKN